MFNAFNILTFGLYLSAVVIYLGIGMLALVLLEVRQPRRMTRFLNDSVFWSMLAWSVWPPVALFVLLYWLVKRPKPYQPPHYL